MDNYSNSEEPRTHSNQPVNRGEDATRGADGDRSLGSFAMNQIQNQFLNSGKTNHSNTSSSGLMGMASSLMGSSHPSSSSAYSSNSHASSNGGIGELLTGLAGNMMGGSKVSNNSSHQNQTNYTGHVQSSQQQQQSGGGFMGSLGGKLGGMMGGHSTSEPNYGYHQSGSSSGEYSGQAPPTSYQPASSGNTSYQTPTYQQPAAPSSTGYVNHGNTAATSYGGAYSQAESPSHHNQPPPPHASGGSGPPQYNSQYASHNQHPPPNSSYGGSSGPYSSLGQPNPQSFQASQAPQSYYNGPQTPEYHQQYQGNYINGSVGYGVPHLTPGFGAPGGFGEQSSYGRPQYGNGQHQQGAGPGGGNLQSKHHDKTHQGGLFGN